MAAVRALSTPYIQLSTRGTTNEAIQNALRRKIVPIFADRIVSISFEKQVTRSWRGTLDSSQITRHYSSTNGLILWHRMYHRGGGHILCTQIRCRHSDADASIPVPSAQDGAQKAKSAVPASLASPIAKIKRKSQRKKSHFSPMKHITINHPKNTSPPAQIPLTRKQLLQLSPKQRANLKQYLIEEEKASRTLLDEARTNVRSNLKYLKGTAESNLKKNIQTIKRLLRGEDIWKDEPAIESSKTNSKQESLQWENLPNAIKTNFKKNASIAQNYLHKLTDGLIPSPSLTSETSTGSVATRAQKFHEMKTHQPLVMDNNWIAWNILLALTPGFLIHLYCLSLQDEMKEFYGDMEKKERERLIGGGESSGGMGISSALITEGGGTWEKIKMAVNDLFFDGIDEKIQTVNAANDESKLDAAKEQSVETTITVEAENDKDATIETLLQRIKALEQRVGIQQQQQPEQTKQQSPMQKRRDERMIVAWKKQEEEKEHTQPNDNEQSFTLQSISDAITSLTEFNSESLKDSIIAKLAEFTQQLPFNIRMVEVHQSNGTVPDPSIVADDSSDTDSALILVDDTKKSDAEDSSNVDHNGNNVAPISSKATVQTQSRWRRWWSSIFSWRRQPNGSVVGEENNES